MIENPEQRRQALFIALMQIPPGCVISYGELAMLAGLGRGARWVGRTLSQLPADTRLPWHRVIAASGHLSLGPDTAGGQEQRKRLQEEGIAILNGKVDMRRHRWQPEA